MEKIIEPDAAYTYAEWAAIAGAGALILAGIVLACWIVTSAKDRLDALHDDENWEWW